MNTADPSLFRPAALSALRSSPRAARRAQPRPGGLRRRRDDLGRHHRGRRDDRRRAQPARWRRGHLDRRRARRRRRGRPGPARQRRRQRRPVHRRPEADLRRDRDRRRAGRSGDAAGARRRLRRPGRDRGRQAPGDDERLPSRPDQRRRRRRHGRADRRPLLIRRGPLRTRPGSRPPRAAPCPRVSRRGRRRRAGRAARSSCSRACGASRARSRRCRRRRPRRSRSPSRISPAPAREHVDLLGERMQVRRRLRPGPDDRLGDALAAWRRCWRGGSAR